MRKLVESTFVTLDGSIGEPQAWGSPYWDDEHAGYSHDLLFAADALLLGRKTYEGFAEAWPARDESDEFTARINAMPKYVASRTLAEPRWNASVIEGDVSTAVAALKQQPGENILKYGTGELDHALLAQGLVDEYHFWIFPVVGGGEPRLFEQVDLTHLQLLGTTVFASGIVVGRYGPKA